MNTKTKKIIAREFLILIVLLLIGGVIVLGVFPYNAVKQSKVDEFSLKIVSIKEDINSLELKAIDKKEKKEWYYSKLNSEFNIDIEPYTRINKIWDSFENQAKQDSLKRKWSTEWRDPLKNFHKKIGFKSGDEFQNFVLNNSYSKSDSVTLVQLDRKLIQMINKMEEVKREKVSDHHHLDIAGGVFFFLFIIMFIFRYLFYAIQWSLNILKNE